MPPRPRLPRTQLPMRKLDMEDLGQIERAIRESLDSAKNHLDSAYKALIQAGRPDLALKLRPVRNQLT